MKLYLFEETFGNPFGKFCGSVVAENEEEAKEVFLATLKDSAEFQLTANTCLPDKFSFSAKQVLDAPSGTVNFLEE